MINRTTSALCLFIAVLAGLTTHASAEVRLTIKEVMTIRPTHDGRYFGRASLQVLANGVWVMTYIHSDHHWACHDGQIEVMFSADEGRTWAPPNTYLDGKPVSGLPSAASPKESPHDPIEPYIYLAPNGDLVIAAMDFVFPGQGKPRPGRGGIWTTASADDGRSWSKWSKVTFRGVPSGGWGDLTQDSFLEGNTIYATSRLRDWRHNNKPGKTLPGLFKSTDNGRTWEFVSCCDSERDWDRTGDSETGIERVGETELVVVIRGGFKTELPWLTRSQDMGKTWTKPVRVSSRVKSWKRARIYTLQHLRHMSGAETIPEWWNDSILIGTGVHQVSVNTRNVGLWYSEDKGNTWSAPLDLDANTQDAGYGDVRVRKNGDLVVVSYHGAYDQASIKQYVVGIETHKAP
ncbi:MAG: sialidase family protein [Pirellulaceae bacterium]